MKQISVLLIVMLLLFTACRDSAKKTDTLPATSEVSAMYLTAKDTTTVTEMVDRFMKLVKARQYDSATHILRKIVVVERDPRPVPLTPQQKEEVWDMFERFPVLDYKIEHIIFKKAENNEVKCRVRISGNTTINWYFKPVRYLGNWDLCLKDSGSGDLPLPATIKMNNH